MKRSILIVGSQDVRWQLSGYDNALRKAGFCVTGVNRNRAKKCLEKRIAKSNPFDAILVYAYGDLYSDLLDDLQDLGVLPKVVVYWYIPGTDSLPLRAPVCKLSACSLPSDLLNLLERKLR